MRDPNARYNLRVAAVHLYREHGSERRAAARLGCHVDTVKRAVRRFEEAGTVMDKPRSGRPAALVGEEVERLLYRGLEQKKQCAQLAADLDRELNIRVSAQTVRRKLVSLGCRSLVPPTKPLLSPQHIAARLAFAKKWRRQGSWDNVVVTDSTYISLGGGGRRRGQREWVRPGCKPQPRQVSKTTVFRLHVYAGVSKHGRTPLFPTLGTTGMRGDSKGVTQQVYMTLLDRQLLPACKQLVARGHYRTWVFQQDNASPHSAKATRDFLDNQPPEMKVMEWPACSPDLSVIENMWGWLQQQVDELQRTEVLTADNFRTHVEVIWNNMPDRVHKKMWDSISTRMAQCVDRRGRHTDY